MIIKCIPTGMFDSNTYIAGANGEAVVIDCGADARDIIQTAEKAGLNIKCVLLTHGHIDHICSVDALREITGARVLVHKNDASCLENPAKNGSALFGISEAYRKADGIVEDGDIIEAGGVAFKVIHTPGHSSGCICVEAGGVIFTGDTLFRLSVGRTDLGDGDYGMLMESIANVLSRHHDDVTIYPGHGEPTTIGFEKKNNPFIRSSLK